MEEPHTELVHSEICGPKVQSVPLKIDRCVQGAAEHPLNSISQHHRRKREVQIDQDELVPEEESQNYKTDFKLTLKSGEPDSMEIGKVRGLRDLFPESIRCIP